MDSLNLLILKELKKSKYNDKSTIRFIICINKIINENEYTTNDVYEDFIEIKNIIGYFDVNYPWGKNNENDIIIEQKLTKLYDLFN